MAVRIKSLFIAGAVLGFGIVGLTSVAHAAEPYGNWVRPSTGTQVNFYACGGKVCAKIVAVKDQSRKKQSALSS